MSRHIQLWLKFLSFLDGKDGEYTASDLRKLSDATWSYAYKTVYKLEKMRWIWREVKGRKKFLMLTHEGKKAAEAANRIVMIYNRDYNLYVKENGR